MAEIKLDIPDITVVVNGGTEYLTNVNIPSVVPIDEDNYFTAADTANTATSASYAQTASYALNVQDSAAFPYTGSAQISGSLQVFGGTISGSFVGDASGLTGVSASVLSGGTATYLPIWDTNSALSSSAIYETPSDVVITKNTTVIGNEIISGSLTVTDNVAIEGTLSVEQLIVSSSVIYASGSTKFGDSPEDTHQFTGSLSVLGPISASSVTGSFKGDGSQLTGLVTDLRISGSTGNDVLSLLTDTLTVLGTNGVTTVVTDNTLTINIPIGLVSSSAQITDSLPVGVVSSSAQATTWTVASASVADTANLALVATNAVSASYIDGGYY